MDRLALFVVVACVAQVGCQTPYSPLTGQSTRVPAPPTGIIGSGDYYSAPPSSATSYVPPTYLPSEQVTNVGAWRYWESADGVREDNSQQNAPARSIASNRAAAPPVRQVAPQLASTRPTAGSTDSDSSAAGLTRNDRLAWREPYVRGTNVLPNNNVSYSQFVRENPPVAAYNDTNVVGSGYVPGFLPNPGSVSPLRVRGFSPSYDRREVIVAPQLAEFLDNGVVRQASATSNWQPRYDDVKR